MVITSVLGSPRKKGNTNRVLTWVEEELQAKGHRINRLNVVEHKVNGCKGCETCQKSTDRPGCAQQDDAIELLDRIMESDTIIYATPVYFWGPTAQMKALIDRHCSLVTGFGTPQWQSLVEGKSTGLVVTCGDSAEDNADLVRDTFKRLADYLKCSYAGDLVVPFATTPDAFGDDVKAQAAAFAQQLVG